MLTDHGENAQSPERRDVRRPRRTYLDHAATSPLRPCAAQAMADTPALGNPSAVHGSGRAARAMLEDAREEIAALLGVRPLEIILTSGGTEADAHANLLICFVIGRWQQFAKSGFKRKPMEFIQQQLGLLLA